MALTMDMVLAATELYDAHFPEWQLSNASLHALRKAFPEWDEEFLLAESRCDQRTLWHECVPARSPCAQHIQENALC